LDQQDPRPHLPYSLPPPAPLPSLRSPRQHVPRWQHDSCTDIDMSMIMNNWSRRYQFRFKFNSLKSKFKMVSNSIQSTLLHRRKFLHFCCRWCMFHRSENNGQLGSGQVRICPWVLTVFRLGNDTN
jgi:hypothetical protein